MRVPLSKVWRAFPELDAFTDWECRGYVEEAGRRRAASGVASRLSGLACGLAIGVVAGAIARSLGASTGLTSGGIDRWFWSSVLLDLVPGVLFLLGPTLGFLLARDLWLRRSIRLRLNIATCGNCRYSLLGLTPGAHPTTGEDVVRCPECGAFIPLRGSGLTREDLMARPGAATERPAHPPTQPLGRFTP